MCVIWNLVTKTYQDVVTLRSFFKIKKKISKTYKKIEKIYTDSEKLINSFEIKKDRLPYCLWDNDCF